MRAQKINLSIILVFLLFILIIILAILGFKEVSKSHKKFEELENKITTLENKINKSEDLITNDNDDTKSLSETEKQELFNKVVKNQLVFIDNIINVKNFNVSDFTDEEILLALPDSSESRIFSEYNEEYFYSIASIVDVENSAKKLFGKTIDVRALNNKNSIRVIGDNVIVGVRSGVGVLDAELLSIEHLTLNQYVIKFKFISSSSNEYKLIINYENGNVVYKGLEK